jgi:hypothetical protein
MPSAVPLIGGGCVLVAVIVCAAVTYHGYRSRGTVRAAARAQPVTFTAPVKIILKSGSGRGIYGPGVDVANLTVCGDVIEISNPARLGRLLAGREFFLDPRSMTLRVERAYGRRERIIIVGVSEGRYVEMTMTSVPGLRPIWEALVAAGAEPAGGPPQDRGRERAG